MKISYVINTAAKDPWVHGKNPHRSAEYRSRYDLMRQHILPSAMEQDFDEIIVAGVFEPGVGYDYIPVAPRCRDRRDALWQREIGARHSTGDILVFGHDDHKLAPDFVQQLRYYAARRDDIPGSWDLLVAKRVHGITGALMNNGFKDGPGGQSYVGSHVITMKRWLWAEVSWTSCNTEFWDTSLTRLWKEAGGEIVFTDALIHVDVEVAAGES